MGKKLLAAVVLLLMMVPAAVFAQSGSVSGKITDGVTGEDLPGANVYLLEIKRGASTDINGSYTIPNVPAGTYQVVASFLGYKQFKTTIDVGSSEVTLDISLDPDVVGLEDVVVTGIASRSSKAVAEVAISRVDAADLTVDKSYQDISQVLSGKVAGVNVQPASGQVGGGIRFNVRTGGGLNGNGQPVIYIDGIRMDNSQVTGYGSGGQGVGTLADLNPEDIESIDVLKGPAGAALYGTAGSNGVVLITTKRGKTIAGKGTVAVNVKSRWGYNEQAVEYDADDIISYEDANAIFVEGAVNQNTVNVSGGTDYIRYFTQFDGTHEEGILPQNSLDRQSFRANFDAFPSNKVTINVSTGFTLNDVARPQNDNNIFGWLGNVVLSPFGTPYNFTDSADVASIENISRTNRFLGSVQLNWRPIDGLSITGSVGFDGSNLRQDNFNPPHRSNPDGNRDLFVRQNQQFTYDLNARYTLSPIDGITFNTVVGTQLFDTKFRTAFMTRSLFQTDLITNIGSGQNIDQADEGFGHRREAGIFFQEEINIKETFFVTVGGRQDFASAIGFDAPNIFYPKASVAVRLDQMGVLPDAINFFKLRAAYGETGILPGSTAGQPLLWTAAPSGFGVGAVIDVIGNPEITPERIREIEFGAEVTFLDNFGVDFTYYIQNSEDAIISFPEAPSTGLVASDIPFNVGGIEGQGLELAVNATPILSKNTQLDLNFIWSHQTNEVTDIGGVQPIRDGFDLNTVQVGLPRSTFYPFEVTGANFAADGSYAGPNILSGEEGRIAMGQPYPEDQFSASINFRFLKNFNLYALAEWQQNVSVFNNTYLFASIFRNNPRFEELRGLLGFSSYYNINADTDDDITALTPGSQEYTDAANEYAIMTTNSDFGYVEEADFFRIREVSLSYNFTDVLKSVGLNKAVKNLTLAASVRNLALFTDYSGVDPEVNFAGARSSSRGQDFLTLQNPRVINATVSIGF